jgi:hypothetical protein
VLHHWYKSLFADELLIIIQPREILLKRIDRKLFSSTKPKIVNTKKVGLIEDVLRERSSEDEWLTLTKYIRQVLAEPICNGTLPHVVLSNHFVRYAVVPWKSELSKSDERIAFASHCFVQAYGERIKSWNFCVSEPEFGQSTIASAIDSNLISKIHDVFDALSMPLHSITPELMFVFNHIIDQKEKRDFIALNNGKDLFWIASIQNQQLCIALYDESGWRLIKNMMTEADVLAQIKANIHREVINRNLQNDVPILLYWPELDKSNQSLNKSFIQIAPYYFDQQKNLTKDDKHDWVIA